MVYLSFGSNTGLKTCYFFLGIYHSQLLQIINAFIKFPQWNKLHQRKINQQQEWFIPKSIQNEKQKTASSNTAVSNYFFYNEILHFDRAAINPNMVIPLRWISSVDENNSFREESLHKFECKKFMLAASLTSCCIKIN